jgi:transcriptional regulator with GAF, ATPase, and Fis domain
MDNSDMHYFHQATAAICGSLDVREGLQRWLDFFKDYFPLDTIALMIYDSQDNSAVNLASVGTELQIPELPETLPDEAAKIIPTVKDGSTKTLDRIEEDPLGRCFWLAMGRINMSGLALNLELDNHVFGVVLFLAKGHQRYTPEHARLLQLVHAPITIALSNTMKHQEVVRLKDLLKDDNKYLNKQLQNISGNEVIGSELGMKSVMDMVRQIAPLGNLVLLLGETGVGKEVIANAIHYSSPRAKGPFIKVNCGAIHENLIDSELFGYEKGAFTGANSLKRGLFERADSGTIFLDEIGELPPAAQVRLLRVLQTHEIKRVGGTTQIPVDTRIITATHRDLPKMVRDGLFREDLLYRLNVFPINIPPLRQRKSDIPALTHHFLEKKSRELNLSQEPVLNQSCLKRMQEYSWPGNIRELENLVERTIILNMVQSPTKMLELDPLYSPVITARAVKAVDQEPPEGAVLLDQVMSNHIRKILTLVDGKIDGSKGAAQLLGINPSTLRNRMNKLNIPYGRKSKSII